MDIYKIEYLCGGEYCTGYALGESETHAKHTAESGLDMRHCIVLTAKFYKKSSKGLD